MHPWRSGLCHEDLHQAKPAHHSAYWGSSKANQTAGTQGHLHLGNLKAYQTAHHHDPYPRLAPKAPAASCMYQQCDIDTVDQDTITADRLGAYIGHMTSMPFNMPSVDQLSPTAYSTAVSGDFALLSPASQSPSQPSTSIDGAMLNQLLQASQNNTVTSLSSSSNTQHTPMPSALCRSSTDDWSVGAAATPQAAAAVSNPVPAEYCELLAQFPASQHKLLLDSLLASSHPQELLQALQGAASSPAQYSPQQHAEAFSNQQLLEYLQLQASLAGQQAALSGSAPVTTLLQQAAIAAAAGSPASNSLVQQLLQQQQATGVEGAHQHLGVHNKGPAMSPMFNVGVAAGNMANSMPALSGVSPLQLLYGNATTAADLWSATAAAGLSNPAIGVAQQKQQQATLSAIIAQAAMLATQQQQQAAILAASAAAGVQHDQLISQVLAGQLGASCPSTFGCLDGSNSTRLCSMQNSSLPKSRRDSAHTESFAGNQQTLFELAGNSKSRRSRISNHASRANSYAMGADAFGIAGGCTSSSTSRANSVAGSEISCSTDRTAIAAAAGVALSDLCPSKFEDCWGAVDNDSSCSSVGGRTSSDASSSWLSSSRCSSLTGSSDISPVSSRTTSSTVESWQSDDELDTTTAVLAACSLASSPSKLQAPADAVKSATRDQNAAVVSTATADASSSKGKQAVSGCPVWYPGAREKAGDDAWYLDTPRTCRLFVGNIGSWVDEDMLMAYFGKYGNVVDVQVMWNTKMLARGRRVNREFAFISYSTALEAARAVHWLDGCRLVDLEKDKSGITVEYENGEGDAKNATGKK